MIKESKITLFSVVVKRKYTHMQPVKSLERPILSFCRLKQSGIEKTLLFTIWSNDAIQAELFQMLSSTH